MGNGWCVVTVPRTRTAVRGFRLGAPNGLPPARPYVYRGSKPYEGPETAKASSDGFADRLARYTGLRDAGVSVEGAAREIGVARRTAQERYEPQWQDRCGQPAEEGP